jgi:UDP-N-acetyl-D-glucosamine/UDP-N-acetyl-D-galactosamine dehydrogenase
MTQIDKIAVVGLGYVGLPLAVEFAKTRPVVGFDVKADRIAALQAGQDTTLEVSAEELAEAQHLSLTSTVADLQDCRIMIVTVPTPIDRHKRPDLTALIRASETVGRALKPGNIVIYESTVYPGATEEVCVPVLERMSGLVANKDFFFGYSPERINPGDKAHRLPNIRKVTSGSTPAVAKEVDALYASIVTAGTYSAASIQVAEAAKVIENTQRDLNIALINELAIIFNRLDLDTQSILDAAGTKWNFLPFRPGLVGGHCIGVDPYYLTHKAEEIGYRPEIILAGRRLNDRMASYVASQLIKAMLAQKITISGSRVLVLGLTFKEDCPDLRNTKVIDLVRELGEFGACVDVHDPWANPEDARREYGLDLVTEPEAGTYDGIILTVAHHQFRDMGIAQLRALGRSAHVLYDIKAMLPLGDADMRL